MKKKNTKIKKNITMADKISAIEAIVDANFTLDEETGERKYTPYYNHIATVIAITTNFLEGIEFEEDDLVYDIVMKDTTLHKLVNKFFYNIEGTDEAEKENKDNKEYIHLMGDVSSTALKMVEFEKERLVHSNLELENYIRKNVEMFESFTDMFTVIADSFRNFSKLDFSKLTPEVIDAGVKIMSKLKDKELTPDLVSDVIKNAVNFDMDKASADIIDYKNKQISDKDERIQELVAKVTELRKYKEKQEARNVKADK